MYAPRLILLFLFALALINGWSGFGWFLLFIIGLSLFAHRSDRS